MESHVRAAARANPGERKRTQTPWSAALREAKMIAGLPPGVAAWWALILVLIAFISWVLTKLGIHICRGFVFDTPEGRTAVVMLFVHLADTDEGVISQSVFLTNIFFDPFVRFLRWSHGMLTNARRNSCVPASVVTSRAYHDISQARPHRHHGLPRRRLCVVFIWRNRCILSIYIAPRYRWTRRPECYSQSHRRRASSL